MAKTLIKDTGYRYVYVPEFAHSYGDGYYPQHRLIMSLRLRRPLSSKEIVHHRNGDKLDNRPANLEIISRADHQRIHLPGKGPRKDKRPVLVCHNCGVSFRRIKSLIRCKNNYCSRECRNGWYKK